ncbi:NUDIX hydrolase [Maioricimonas sp. JC845]|uniref:NUDIX hydrolase n=1 Tax=Maioricimonas sp. JC845 TaxID=3232138 RepID=UPI0034599250
MAADSQQQRQRTILAEGKFLRLVNDNGWEYAERANSSGVVAVIATTDAGQLVLTEQYRPAVCQNVIDLPAGLAGDIAGEEDEALSRAAWRELVEETGFEADGMTELFTGPPSAGMSSEQVTFFRAGRLTRVHDGGGDHSEDITVHLVPVETAREWLIERAGPDRSIDPKVFAGLYFARQ